MSTVLPNIGVVVPDSGDSDYPTSISTSLTNLDNHDHTTGKGLPIGTSALSNSAVTTAKIADSNVTTAKIADLNVTRAKLVAVGQQVSSSCGTFGTNSATLTDVTNLSVSLTTTGRPVILVLVPDAASALPCYVGAYQSTNVDLGPQAEFAILRDAAVISRHQVSAFGSAVTSDYISSTYVPPGSVMTLDAPAAGTYTYKVQARYSSFTVTANMQAVALNVKLVAYEL